MKIAQRIGAATTAALLLFWIVGLIWLYSPRFVWRVVAYLFSGQIFTSGYIITGGALDQHSLNKGFFMFCWFFLLIVPYVFGVRWISDWRQKAVRVAFRVLSFPLFLFPFLVLTVVFFELLHYIYAMGFTPRRWTGVAFSVAGYVALFGALYWAWRYRSGASGRLPEATGEAIAAAPSPP